MAKMRRHLTVRVFKSHAQADAADQGLYAQLTAEEKLMLVETLRLQAYELLPAYRAQPRLPRHAWPVVKTWREISTDRTQRRAGMNKPRSRRKKSR